MVHGCLTFAHSIPTTVHHGLSSNMWLLCLLHRHLWMWSRRLVMVVVMVEIVWHFGLWRGGWQLLGNWCRPRRMAVARVRFRLSVLVRISLGGRPVTIGRQVTRLRSVVCVLRRHPLLLLELGRRQLGGRMLVWGSIGVATRMLIYRVLRWHPRRRHPVSTVERGRYLPVWNVRCWGLVGLRDTTTVRRMHRRRTPRVLLVDVRWGMVHGRGMRRLCVVLLRLLRWRVMPRLWRVARCWRRSTSVVSL